MRESKINPSLPSSSNPAVEHTVRGRPGVGFPHSPSIHSDLPSIPRHPPNADVPEPAFHPGLHPTLPPQRYPSLMELHDNSMRDYPLLYATAPWFSALKVRDVDNIECNFADGAGMLPGPLPLRAISSYDWRARIATPPSILRLSSSRGRQGLSLRFMEAVLNRLNLFLSDALIPASFGCDTWKFRTDGERDYLDNLLTWSRGDPVVEADCLWHGRLMVTNDALSWTRPILLLNFRRTKCGNIPFFQHTVRFESKMRSGTGYFLAYQMVGAGEIARSHYTNRYQQRPSWWGQFEVCQGFWAELGPILTYFGSHLNDPRHELWVVFLKEWCVKVAATLLWEAYDCW